MKRLILVVSLFFVGGVFLPSQGLAEASLKAHNHNCCKRNSTRRERAAEAARLKKIAMVRARIARERYLAQLAFDRSLKTKVSENILKDVATGEDPIVRAAAIDALGNRAGTVVVMEIETGKIVTMVNQDWAIRRGFKPCSTIKLLTSLAGLKENVIDENGKLRNKSSSLNLENAIAHSDNGYFQQIGKTVGNEKMISYAQEFGLGSPTGINAPEEYAGRLPYGNNSPRIYSHGDDFELTPLQLTVLVAEIANGGHKVTPQIPNAGVSKDSFQPRPAKEVKLPQNNLQDLVKGMIGSASYGTASKGLTPYQKTLGIAGKTGSCIQGGTWIGLFTSVAPITKPKYAVVSIARGQSQRGKWEATVVGKIYEVLLKPATQAVEPVAIKPRILQ